ARPVGRRSPAWIECVLCQGGGGGRGWWAHPKTHSGFVGFPGDERIPTSCPTLHEHCGSFDCTRKVKTGMLHLFGVFEDTVSPTVSLQHRKIPGAARAISGFLSPSCAYHSVCSVRIKLRTSN